MKRFYLEIALRVMNAENEVPVKTSIKAEYRSYRRVGHASSA